MMRLARDEIVNPEIRDELIVKEARVIPVLFHEQRETIMKLLIDGQRNIIDLSKVTKMNPGTIKRHVDLLVQHGLATLSTIDTNEYGIKLKYYRATARKFTFSFSWP